MNFKSSPLPDISYRQLRDLSAIGDDDMAHHDATPRVHHDEMTWREHLSVRGILAGLPRLPSREQRKAGGSLNPISIVASLTPMNHLMFFSGWYAWTMDAVDFFAVSLTVSKLAVQFGKANSDITLAITLTLLFRSLGAVIFGLLGDRFGRKWVLVSNLLIVAALELGSGFVTTFQQFLAVRSLFGIGMGGIWGLAASTALENLPAHARGLYSGILQQGYAVGYLIAALINLYLVNPRNDWTLLFKVGAGLSVGAAALRACLPESRMFIEANERRKAEHAAGVQGSSRSVQFMKEAGRAVRVYWARCIIAILLMTGFNFFSHGSQDLYPTIIQSRGFSSDDATKATIVGNVGAIVGGTICGALSQYLGRRLTIVAACVWVLCFLPLWYLPTTLGGLMAGAFTVQMGVQGAWGVIPIFLQELSPPAFRAVWPGLAYQLGNAASSASSQIEATAGENIQLNGKPDYAKVSIILIAVVAGWIMLITMITPEAHAAEFEKAKTAFEHGGGAGVIATDEHAYKDGSARDEEIGKSSEKIDDAHTPPAHDEKHSI